MTGPKLTKTNQKGFTIVELMIAIAVLSVILILATVVLVQVGHLYHKGVTQAQTQDTARNVLADITSSLQLGGGKFQTAVFSSDPNVKSVCIGTVRYTYIVNHQNRTGDFDATHSPHVLWRDAVAPDVCTSFDLKQATTLLPADAQDGREMLSEGMRLTKFSVSPMGGVGSTRFSVQAWLAYGDDDLLTAPDAGGHRFCKPDAGGQFCALSELNTVVTRRLEE